MAAARRGRAGDQAGLRVRARPRDRQRRCSRSRSGRFPRATCPASARGRRSRCRPRRRRSCRSASREADLYAPTPAHLARVPRAARRAAQRRPVHAAEPARVGALSVHGRRRELVGRELRPRAPAARRAGAESRAHRDGSTRSASARRAAAATCSRSAARACARSGGCSRAAARATATASHPLGGRVVFEHDGVPCNRPPWGRLVAVDLARGAIAWSASTSTRDGDPGSCGYGPALVTASGLVFHGGTRAPVLRVHDVRTGARIATFDLPAGLHAGPISYKLAPGRQAVPRRRAGRSRGRRLADRRRGDRVHAAVTHLHARSITRSRTGGSRKPETAVLNLRGACG